MRLSTSMKQIIELLDLETGLRFIYYLYLNQKKMKNIILCDSDAIL